MGKNRINRRARQLLVPVVVVLCALLGAALPAGASVTGSDVVEGRLEQLRSGQPDRLAGYVVRTADGPVLLHVGQDTSVDDHLWTRVRATGTFDPTGRSLTLVEPLEPLGPAEPLPTEGRWRVLVVRASFSDGLQINRAGDASPEGIDDVEMAVAADGASRFVDLVSRGRLDVDMVVRPGWLSTSVPRSAGGLALEAEVDRRLAGSATPVDSFDKVVVVAPRAAAAIGTAQWWESVAEVRGSRAIVGGWHSSSPAGPLVRVVEQFAGVVDAALWDDCLSRKFLDPHASSYCGSQGAQQHDRGDVADDELLRVSGRQGPWGFQLAAASWSDVADVNESGRYLLSPAGSESGAPSLLRVPLADGSSVVLEYHGASWQNLNALTPAELEKISPKLTARSSGIKDTILGRGIVARSPNQRFGLVNQVDGNLVLRDLQTGAVRWSTGTGGHPAASAQMVWGRLVVVDEGRPSGVGRTLYEQTVRGALFVTDDGRLEARTDPAYGARRTWDSVVGLTGSDNSTLRPGDRLSSGERVGYDPYIFVAPDGQVRGRFEFDHKDWASGTAGHPGAYLEMGLDGVLRVNDRDGRTLWRSTGEATPGSRLLVGWPASTIAFEAPDGRRTPVRGYSFNLDVPPVPFSLGPVVWHVVDTPSGPVGTALDVVQAQGTKAAPWSDEVATGEFRADHLGLVVRNEGYDEEGNVKLVIENGRSVAPGAVSVGGVTVRRNQVWAAFTIGGPQHRVGHLEVARSATRDQVGQVVALAPAAAPRLAGLSSSDGNWWLRVRAVAPGGSAGPWSAPFQVQLDATPPSAPPQLSGRRTSKKVELRWGASVDQLSGVDKYAVIRNGRLVAAVEPGQPVSWASERGAAGGTFSVVAIDEQGNMSPASVRVVK